MVLVMPHQSFQKKQLRKHACVAVLVYPRRDSNPQPTVPKTVALAIELRGRNSSWGKYRDWKRWCQVCCCFIRKWTLRRCAFLLFSLQSS